MLRSVGPMSDEGAVVTRFKPVARALNSLADAVGRPFTMRTQRGRFRIQKTVYLLRHLRYAPAQKYSFNIYHMGPYSPELAKGYYHLEDDGMRAAGVATDIPTATISVVTEALSKDDAMLEGLATFLDIWSVSHSGSAALAQAKAVKSHLQEATWREVRAFLTDHPGLTPAT